MACRYSMQTCDLWVGKAGVASVCTEHAQMVNDSPEVTGQGVGAHVRGSVDNKAQLLLGNRETPWGLWSYFSYISEAALGSPYCFWEAQILGGIKPIISALHNKDFSHIPKDHLCFTDRGWHI